MQDLGLPQLRHQNFAPAGRCHTHLDCPPRSRCCAWFGCRMPVVRRNERTSPAPAKTLNIDNQYVLWQETLIRRGCSGACSCRKDVATPQRSYPSNAGTRTRLTLLSLQEVEACRAVKRLQIASGDLASDLDLQVRYLSTPAACHACTQKALHLAVVQDTSVDSWPATGDLVNAAQQLQLLKFESTDKQEPSCPPQAPCQVPVVIHADKPAAMLFMGFLTSPFVAVATWSIGPSG